MVERKSTKRCIAYNVEFILSAHNKKYCSRTCSQKNSNLTYPTKLLGRYNTAKKECTRSRNANKSNKNFSITIEYYAETIFKKNCVYCEGVVGNYGTGMDRIDNSIGYEVGNVVPCCSTCNRLKSNTISFQEMFAIIDLLKKLRNRSVLW